MPLKDAGGNLSPTQSEVYTYPSEGEEVLVLAILVCNTTRNRDIVFTLKRSDGRCIEKNYLLAGEGFLPTNRVSYKADGVKPLLALSLGEGVLGYAELAEPYSNPWYSSNFANWKSSNFADWCVEGYGPTDTVASVSILISED